MRVLHTLLLFWIVACTAPVEGVLDVPADPDADPDRVATPEETRAKLLELIEFLYAYTGNLGELGLDREALTTEALATLDNGNASELAYHTAAWHVFRAFRNGHADFRSDGCGSTIPAANVNGLGVCLQPLGDDLVVTAVSEQNLLHWERGDRVVAIAGLRGEALREAALRLPVCAPGIASESARRQHVAGSVLGFVGPGVELTIESAAGVRRSVTLEAGMYDPMYCLDPLGRTDHEHEVLTYRRPDGVAVIRVPSFYPRSVPEPTGTSDEELAAYVEATTRVYLDAFRTVADAPAIVWDARANTGGVTPAALAIVGGMPSARATDLSYCEGRIPGSDPPAMFPDVRGGEYRVVPGGPFAYTGGVAVIVDGRSVSAGDYFALAVRRATDVPLVGSPTAGGYGSPGTQHAGLYGLSVTTDSNRCVDAAGQPLEGHGVEPTLAVDYAPADLRAGLDTVLEAAAEVALAQRSMASSPDG